MLLHLANAQAIADQLIRIEPDLVFLGHAAEGGHVDDAGNILVLLGKNPVLERLLLHDIDIRIFALDGVPVDLSRGTPICLQLRDKPGRKRDHSHAFQHSFPIPAVVRIVVEVHHQARNAGKTEGAHVLHVRQSGHLDFSGNGNLLFDILGRMPRPLRNDVYVVIGNIGIGVDREIVKRDCPPDEEHHCNGQNEKAALERKVYEFLNHCASSVASS